MLIYADIELMNATDMTYARHRLISKEEIKRVYVNMRVDNRVYMMAINETIQARLALPFIEDRTVQLAGGEVVQYPVAGPLMVKFANRTAMCNAFVLPGDSEPILGAIPMGELDVLIDPLHQKLIVNPAHPDGAQLKMKQLTMNNE